jgi:hypothetical protein
MLGDLINLPLPSSFHIVEPWNILKVPVSNLGHEQNILSVCDFPRVIQASNRIVPQSRPRRRSSTSLQIHWAYSLIILPFDAIAMCSLNYWQPKKRQIFLCNRPWRPIGLWDVETPTYSRQSAHRWRWGCQPYAPAALYPTRKIPGTHFC